jgi:hypothetical protein
VTESEIAMLGTCRRRVGNAPAGDVLLFIVMRTRLSEEHSPTSVARRWHYIPRSWFTEQLNIPTGTYRDAITRLRDAGLIEWRHDGGRGRARMRLTVEAEGWARAEGYLPEQTAVHEPGLTGVAQ